jgi:hypothetical protein
MTQGNTFLLSWDCNGREAVVNVSAMDAERTWATLQDKPGPNLNSIVNGIMLRARYNSQRHYEIYTVNMDDSISEQDVRDMFETSPQAMADLIRERGHKMYSDRVDHSQVKIV